MRRWSLTTLCLLVPLAARANPVIIDPSSLIAFGVVALFALIVEAGIVALFLAFGGLAPMQVFWGFLLANLAVFFFIFCPLQQRVPLPLLEFFVVVSDAVAIKLLAGIAAFQGDNYKGVSWLLAGVTALAGNAASFFVGVIAAGAPWEMHGPDE